jgi:heme-degrading monooxygenase HmoA
VADEIPVQHIVLFKFPRELTADEDLWMKEQIRRWPSEIGGFTKLRLGRDITGKRNRGHQYLLFTEFPSNDALQAYFLHPVHQEFGKRVAEMECEVLAFDYALDPTTTIVGGSSD